MYLFCCLKMSLALLSTRIPFKIGQPKKQIVSKTVSFNVKVPPRSHVVINPVTIKGRIISEMGYSRVCVCLTATL